MLKFLWRASRGFRLTPWRSPYLLWRVETFWGIPAEEISFGDYMLFLWRRRRDMLRYLRWVERMQYRHGG
jgi:hypothetical protein